MNATETKQKIQASRQRFDRLEGWIKTLEAARVKALRELPAANETDRSAATRRNNLRVVEHGWNGEEVSLPDAIVRELTGPHRLPGLHGSRAELATLRDQVEVLTADLPSGEELAAAEAKAAELRGRADAKAAEFGEAWAAVLAALDAAEAAALATATTRKEQWAAVAAVERLSSEFGLEQPTPGRVRTSDGDQGVMLAVLALTQGIGLGDDVDPRHVSTLRQRREKRDREREREAA